MFPVDSTLQMVIARTKCSEVCFGIDSNRVISGLSLEMQCFIYHIVTRGKTIACIKGGTLKFTVEALRAKFKATAIHFSISAVIFFSLAYLIYFVWYPQPYFSIDGGWQ